MAASAITVKGSGNFFGGQLEFGTFVLDAASIAANAQGIETAAITCKTGDMVFVQPRAMATSAVCVGAKVTGANEVSVYLNNTIDATTAVDLGSLTFDYILIRLS